MTEPKVNIQANRNTENLPYISNDMLCGIDGGGTTTKVVVADLEGHIIYSFQTGTTNHYGAGIEKAQENFASIAKNLREQLGCLPGIIFKGNSALDGLAEEEQVQQLTRGVFNPSKVIFHSDVYIALLGFTLGEAGTMLIAGTGSMACGLDAGGIYHTAGGWGQVLGDEGSAYHLALEGIKAGLRAYDGVSEPTTLTARIMQHFGLSKMSDIINQVYHPPVEKSIIAAFASAVEVAAHEGDKVALRILEDEAVWLYKLALAITNKCKTTKLGFYGGVLNGNELVRLQLAERLERHSIALQAPMFSPEIGALIGAFREAGINLNEKLISNLLKYKQGAIKK